MFPPFCGGADRPKPPKPPPACWRLPPPNNPSNISPKSAPSPLNSWEAPPGPPERKPPPRPPPKPNGAVGFPSPSISPRRSEEHTSELQSLMRISYAVFCLKKKNKQKKHNITPQTQLVITTPLYYAKI